MVVIFLEIAVVDKTSIFPTVMVGRNFFTAVVVAVDILLVGLNVTFVEAVSVVFSDVGCNTGVLILRVGLNVSLADVGFLLELFESNIIVGLNVLIVAVGFVELSFILSVNRKLKTGLYD